MDWTKQFPAAITISDLNGTIIYMNDKAASVFAGDGGYNLIGKSLFDCHSRAANDKINEIINSKNPNAYTIEKNGTKKLIYQAPYYENDKICGIVELSIEIPFNMPHHIRS